MSGSSEPTLSLLSTLSRTTVLAAVLATVVSPGFARAEEPGEVDLGALAEAGDVSLGDLDGEAPPDDEETAGEDGKEPGGRDSVAGDLEAGSGVRVQAICTNCNQANLTVNGVTGSDHVLVTFDDVPAIGGLGSVYGLIQFPAELVGYSHVARGPGSVLSGAGGMGGTIAMHSADAFEGRRVLMDARVGSWNSRTLKLGGADEFGRVGALVFLQAVHQDAVDGNGDSDIVPGGNEVAAFDRLTAHGIFDIELTQNQNLRLSGLYYGEDQVDGPGRPTADPRDPAASYFEDEDVQLNWKQLGAAWEWDGPDGLQLTVRTNWSRRFQAQEAPIIRDGEPEKYLRVNDERLYSNVQVQAPMGAGLLTAGVGYQKLKLRVYSFESILVPWITDGLDTREAWVEWSQGVGSKVSYSLGARYEDFTVFGYTTPRNSDRVDDPDIGSSFFLPRAHLAYRPNGKVVLSADIGRFAVGPTPAAEKTCCGAQYERSRELEPESAWSYQVAAEVHPTPDQRLTLTAFRTDFDDYIQRSLSKITFFIPTYANRNIESARVQGFDLVHDMRFRGNRWNLGWTYTYSDSREADGTELLYLPKQAASAYLRYDDQRRGTKINFDIRWTGSVRHYYVPAVQGIVDEVDLTFQRSSSFYTADVSFEQRLGKKGWWVQGGVQNITDYVQADLSLKDANDNGYRDQFERCFDWGPLTGRYLWAGLKFTR